MKPTAFLDFETHLFAPGVQLPPIVCGAFAAGEGGDAWLEKPGRAGFEGALLGGRTMVAHHAAFDMGAACANWPELIPAVFDAYASDRVTCTLLRQQLIDIGAGAFRWMREAGGGYGLANCAKRALGVELDKSADTWRLHYESLENIPIESWPTAAVEYPKLDATTCRDVYKAQAAPEYERFLVDQHRQARAAFALQLTAAWGLTTCPVEVDKFEIRNRLRLAEIDDTMRSHGLVRAAGTRDMKAIGARVRAAYGGDPPMNKTGPKTDAITLVDSGDPVLAMLGERGKVGARLSKDLPMLRRGILHTRFDIADTGRSTSGGEDEDGESHDNVQNFARSGGVRECFVPRPGWVYCLVDAGSLELCTLAQVEIDLFGNSLLADALNSGIDCHLALACELLGITYEEGLARKAAGDSSVLEAREVAKIANFGFPGGLSHRTFVGYAMRKSFSPEHPEKTIRITEQRSFEIRSAWARRWRLDRYFDHVARIVNTTREFTQVRSMRVRGGCGYTDGCNGYFQGLGADVMKDAFFRIVRACYDFSRPGPLLGCKPVNFVHDSADVEALEERAPEAAEEMSRIMIATAAEWMPNVKMKAEPVIARRLSKSAKTKRAPDGRLIPWDVAA